MRNIQRNWSFLVSNGWCQGREVQKVIESCVVRTVEALHEVVFQDDSAPYHRAGTISKLSILSQYGSYSQVTFWEQELGI